jgi:hypothetical protein
MQNMHAASLEVVVTDEFLHESLEMLKPHISSASWEQAIETVRFIEQRWNDRLRDTDIGQAVMGDVLAIHVSWLRLDPRTVNILESICAGTVGSLLPSFPSALVDCPNVGPGTVRRIAEALCRIGALSRPDARLKFEEYLTASKARK